MVMGSGWLTGAKIWLSLPWQGPAFAVLLVVVVATHLFHGKFIGVFPSNGVPLIGLAD